MTIRNILNPTPFQFSDRLNSITYVPEESILEIPSADRDSLQAMDLGRVKGVTKSIINRIELDTSLFLKEKKNLLPFIHSYTHEVTLSNDCFRVRFILKIFLSLEVILKEKLKEQGPSLNDLHGFNALFRSNYTFRDITRMLSNVGIRQRPKKRKHVDTLRNAISNASTSQYSTMKHAKG